MRLMPLLVLLLLSLTAACGRQEPLSAGRTVYLQSNCRTCHQIGGEGRYAGPDLSFVGFRHKKEWLDRWLADPSAVKPDTTMPNPRLTPEARGALVEYLAGLRGGPLEETDGKRLFRRAGCTGCHGEGGRGGYPGVPKLQDTASTYTKEELIGRIRDGVKSGRELEMPAWGETLTEAQLAALADWLLTLKPSSPDPGF